MLVEFLTGQLPWRKIKDKEQVGLMKEKYDHALFLKCLPSEFKALLEHIQELKYEDAPDYELLMDVFRSAKQRKNVKESDLYDWERETNNEEDSVNALQNTLAVAAITTRAEMGVNQSSQKNPLAGTMAQQSLMDQQNLNKSKSQRWFENVFLS